MASAVLISLFILAVVVYVMVNSRERDSERLEIWHCDSCNARFLGLRALNDHYRCTHRKWPEEV